MKISEVNGKTFEELEGEGLTLREYIPIKDKIDSCTPLVDVIVKTNGDGCKYIDWTIHRVTLGLLKGILYAGVELDEGAYESYDILVQSGILYQIEKIHDSFALDEVMDSLCETELDSDGDFRSQLMEKVTSVVNILDRAMDHVNALLDRADVVEFTEKAGKIVSPIVAKLPDFSKVDAEHIAEALTKLLDRKKPS